MKTTEPNQALHVESRHVVRRWGDAGITERKATELNHTVYINFPTGTPMLRALILLLPIIILTGCYTPQTFEKVGIRGVVRDADTGAAISTAEIGVNYPDVRGLGVYGKEGIGYGPFKTDADGTFSIIFKPSPQMRLWPERASDTPVLYCVAPGYLGEKISSYSEEVFRGETDLCITLSKVP